MLIYPWVDLTRTDRSSYIAFSSGFGLSTKDIEESLELYALLPIDRAHPDISPLHAKSATPPG